mmetsp:Transcript_33422/g.65192  ORF Transcript_33422/g.65192 Transcript_33422/m.65192 type:complete len:283 (+) Transcript_33422:72-920(+)
MKNYIQMNDEIEQIDTELTDMLGKIRGDVEALEWDTKKVALPKDKRDEECARITSQIASARSVHQNYRVELRDLGREDLARYEPKAKAHLNTIEELTRSLAYAKATLEKRELMGDRADKQQEGKDPTSMGAKQLVQEAEKTQQEDLKAVTRMQQMVEDTEDVGVETNIKLKLQTEQMKNIQVDVYSVNETMKRADKLVNHLSKRLATDKLIVCLLFAIMLGIFMIIVAKSLGAGDQIGVNGDVIKIDCSLDITKTHKQCLEIAAKMVAENSGRGGGRRARKP